MRAILQKIGALVLAVGALGALLAQAALTHGCGGAPAKQGEVQAPSAPAPRPQSAAPSSAPEAAAPASAPEPAAPAPTAEPYEETEYMGATKAPPLPGFRRSPKPLGGGDVEKPENAGDGNTGQAP